MIRLQHNSPVTIQCPSASRYPSFYKAFHGKKGRVIAVEPKGAENVIVVDISDADKGEAGIWINVASEWLAHAKASTTPGA